MSNKSKVKVTMKPNWVKDLTIPIHCAKLGCDNKLYPTVVLIESNGSITCDKCGSVAHLKNTPEVS